MSKFTVGDSVVITRLCPRRTCGCVVNKHVGQDGSVDSIDSAGTSNESARIVGPNFIRWFHTNCLEFTIEIPDGVWTD